MSVEQIPDSHRSCPSQEGVRCWRLYTFWKGIVPRHMTGYILLFVKQRNQLSKLVLLTSCLDHRQLLWLVFTTTIKDLQSSVPKSDRPLNGLSLVGLCPFFWACERCERLLWELGWCTQLHINCNFILQVREERLLYNIWQIREGSL